MTHAEAKAKFRRCRNKERGNLLAKHTRLQERGRAFAVRYHNTDVVMIRPDGTYRLNTGGWRTPTTTLLRLAKERYMVRRRCLLHRWNVDRIRW